MADAAFCEVIAEDLGIKSTTARTAFLGEPKVRCIRVIEWALRYEPDDAEKRAKMVLAWARKRRAGVFREDDAERVWERRNSGAGDEEEAEREIARAVARYWAEHPEKLAELLREALKNGGGE